MADAAYLDNSSPTARWTFGDVLSYAENILNKEISGTDRTLLLLDANAELEAWRSELPKAFKGLGEQRATLTFDPASTPTRLELPADFEETLPAGRAYFLGTDLANPSRNPMELLYEQEWKDSFVDGVSIYDDRDVPVGVLFGTSVNRYRFIELYPVPTATVYIDFPYLRRLTKLTLDADILEGPMGIHRGIAYGVVTEYLDRSGFGERAKGYAAKRNRTLDMLKGHVHETHRVSRFRRPGEVPIDQYTTYPR